jgi:hypothetical protein
LSSTRIDSIMIIHKCCLRKDHIYLQMHILSLSLDAHIVLTHSPFHRFDKANLLLTVLCIRKPTLQPKAHTQWRPWFVASLLCL